MFGQDRSKRYVLTVEDGKVKDVFVEPDNTGVNGMYLCLEICSLCHRFGSSADCT